MADWIRHWHAALVWTAANEAPRGFVAAVVTLWTVAFMSALVWRTTERLFEDITKITPAAATAYTALLATGLAGAWGFFQWARKKRSLPGDA